MKIRNLLLGSLAVAGLTTTGAYAADLGVLTSLDVCDSLGLSGLTISSDTNCLQITGEVKYKFIWGDYDVDGPSVGPTTVGFRGNDGFVDTVHGATDDSDNNDWDSRFDAWIKFVATADSDFGPAKAVLKLKQVDHDVTTNEDGTTIGSSDTGGVVLDEAYVSIGDSTKIIAGKASSIMNKSDDAPLDWLGGFISADVDAGVSWGPADLPDGGHVIQVVSDLGNGITVSAGLENLNGSNDQNADNAYGSAGTAVGVIAYKGDGISAHVTVAAGGVLDGEIEDWGVHAGFAGTFDNFKVVLAGAYGHDEGLGALEDYWNVLASASATFDMFTLAGSLEAKDDGVNDGWGGSASVAFAVSDGVTLNVGGRWFDGTGAAGYHDGYQVAAGVAAEVTEGITLSGEVGYVNDDTANDDLFYGKAKLEWAPGGDTFTSSLAGTVTSENGYKIESEFKKTFQ